MAPVYAGVTTVAGGFKRAVWLPDLPRTSEALIPYLADLDRAIADIAGEERLRLQTYISQRDSAAFAASDVAVVITFGSSEPDTDYLPVLVPSWNTKTWYSALTADGFTINASDAPGGSGGTIKWAVIR